MLDKNSGIYGKEMTNTGNSVEEKFVVFINQILDVVDLRYESRLKCKWIISSHYNRLEEEENEKKNEYPGDFIPEIRIVWATCGSDGKVLEPKCIIKCT